MLNTLPKNLLSQENWYAFYTSPRSEKKVFERVNEQNLQAYLPLITEVKQWSDRKKKITTPLIPSYVFVKADERKFNKILGLCGINGVLKHLGKPAIVHNYEIENLKILCNVHDEVKILSNNEIARGDLIKVVKGNFTGLTGISVSIKGKHRVLVEIEALNNKYMVEIPSSFVEKIG